MRAPLSLQEPAPPNRRLQISMRRLVVLVGLSSLLLVYVESYRRLSHRGMREAQEFGIAGFLYVPFAEAAASEDLTRHYALATFYAPLNWIDRAIFGAPSPYVCIMWRLSG
jgi:hypothetical protein